MEDSPLLEASVFSYSSSSFYSYGAALVGETIIPSGECAGTLAIAGQIGKGMGRRPVPPAPQGSAKARECFPVLQARSVGGQLTAKHSTNVVVWRLIAGNPNMPGLAL